jgi:GDPmannose 4,6-dehydratase
VTRALVTGVTGQDGSYLAELLVAEGIEVHGLVRPSDPQLDDLRALVPGVQVHEGDLTSADSVIDVVAAVDPDEVYNLAGISSVARSWEHPAETADLTGAGAVRVLEAVALHQERSGHEVRFLQASSAEIFGEPAHSPQDESTPLNPITPYGAAKAFAHQVTGLMRHRGIHASTVILYNHESPRRPTAFVTRKITSTVAAIARGEADRLVLGNLDASRDWGFAGDYVEAMHRAVRHDEPGDYVVATGVAHSVRDFVAAAFAAAGIAQWEQLVDVDPAFVRPRDATLLVGNAAKAFDVLGWTPTTSFAELVAAMVAHDLRTT